MGGVPGNFTEIYLSRTEKKWERTLGDKTVVVILTSKTGWFSQQ